MKKAILSVFALMLFVSPLAIMAQDADTVKIGIINMRRVLAESTMGKAAEDKVKEFVNAKRNELLQEANKLQEDAQQLESQKSVLSETAFLDRQNELQKRDLELKQKQQAVEREFQTIQRDELQKFMEIASPIIEAVGVEQGFTLIIDNTPSATNQIIYFNKANDITDLVVERINARSTGQ